MSMAQVMLVKRWPDGNSFPARQRPCDAGREGTPGGRVVLPPAAHYGAPLTGRVRNTSCVFSKLSVPRPRANAD